MSPGKVTIRVELFPALIIPSLLIDNSSWSRELMTKLYPAFENSACNHIYCFQIISRHELSLTVNTEDTLV